MIHNTAIISDRATIGEDVSIGPYAVIGPAVTIGAGTVVGAHTVIDGKTTIGRGNRIFNNCSLGTAPQDISYAGEDTELVIGDHNTIREFCLFNRGTPKGGGVTTIGSHNLLMGYVHVAHDCIINDRVIIANATQMAGHVTIDSNANIGGLCGIHQFCRIGSFCMVGGCAAISEDVLPYSMVAGNRARTMGLNRIGLVRNGFAEPVVKALKHAFRLIFQSRMNTTEALKNLKTTYPDMQEIQYLIDFIQSSQRGISGYKS